MSSIFSVDYFRNNCQKIHFFGLGFIQVKMSESTRYHFYHPQFQGFVETPHDHRYWFRSQVLKGSLMNRVWTFTNVENYFPDYKQFNASLRVTTCTPDGPDQDVNFGRPPARICAEEVTSFLTQAGSEYYLSEETFHQVIPSTTIPCVTRLTRGPKTKEYAQIIQLDYLSEACPFSRNMPESDLWEIVRDCIL